MKNVNTEDTEDTEGTRYSIRPLRDLRALVIFVPSGRVVRVSARSACSAVNGGLA
jgi:hypothetical protein